MITAQSHPNWAWSKLLILLFVAILALPSIVTTAVAQPSHRSPQAHISAVSRALNAAAASSVAADRALVSDARALNICKRKHRKHCKASGNAVQRAGHRLAITERSVAKLARGGGRNRTTSTSAATQAPQLTVSGQTLNWTNPGNVSSFVFVRKVPGQEDQYSIVKGTTATPPPVPGYTVNYSVRTNVSGSVWAVAQNISYPAISPPATTPPTSTTPVTTPPTTTTTTTSTTPPPTTTTPTPTPPTDTRTAPIITVSGQTLTWTQIGAVNTYVLVTKVPGQEDRYSTVSGTSITPPPVAGATVRYSVRTAVEESLWAPEVTITYPASAPTPPPANTKEAPTITVSGQTLHWNAVAGVSSYAFVRKVPGQADQYSILSATSVTPPVTPGTTVRYSVRTNVEESLWAPEVTIVYPAAEPAPEPTPEPTPPVTQPGSGPFEMGVVAGAELTYELPFVEKLGTHTARMEFEINTPATQMASKIEAYARAGIRPLLLASFYGRMPSASEAQNLANWAKEFGPGGTLWQGKSFPAATAVTTIEFGNETSYTYQYSDNSTAGYASRAQTYALRLKEAHEAIQAVNSQVGLLAQGDSGGSGPEWANNMFKAVPNLGQLVAGWTIHPYGPEWQSRIDNLISTTQADGAPNTVPVYVTEWGLDTDNGHCLEYNFGWNKCMTYSEAASTLGSAVSAMRSRYGSRLAALYLYQAHDQAPTGTSTSLESSFGALQSNGSPKGAYTTEVQSLLSANP